MDRAIGQCIASIAISAGVGALIGAVNNRQAAGRGALIGAAVGVGSCAVLIEVAQGEDRARIRDAERQAIETNNRRTTVFRAKTGKQVAVTTSVVNAPIPKKADRGDTAVAQAETKKQFTACRYSQQTIAVDGQSAGAGKQLWCRSDTGDWQPMRS